MRPAPDGSHVWRAPNGTGYLVLFFQGPEEQVSTDFPYAITDFRNKPVKLEQIDSAVLCNSQRRGFAACAAFTFGLGYELWAREEVTAEEPELVPANDSSSDSPQPATKKKAALSPLSSSTPFRTHSLIAKTSFSASSRPITPPTKASSRCGPHR